MSLTTWTEIRQGDQIRALDGSLWHVEYVVHKISDVWNPAADTIMAGIHDGDIRTEVTYPATDPVERVEQTITFASTGSLLGKEVLPGTYVKPTEQAPIYAPPDDAKQNSDPEMDRATDLITQADIDVEVIAEETTEEQQAREVATRDEPLVLPAIESPLKLRSHLYLVHSYHLPEIPQDQAVAAALLEHHRRCHEIGPMENPHVHRDEDVPSQ